jgi:membrane protein YdbS with pleckstrin-like domain
MKNANEIVIGKPVKISHVLIGAAAIVILSLFVTGFGYLPWWVFLIVLILGIFITLPTCFNSYWRINNEKVKDYFL